MLITTYVSNKNARMNAGFIGGRYVLDGKSYSKTEFNKNFPITGKLERFNDFRKGTNPDISKNFIHDQKSY